MRRFFSPSISLTLTFTLIALLQQTASAQNAANKTILTVEIMLPRITGDPAMAQRWGSVFNKMGEAVRVRQPLPGDEPEIKETKRGTFRVIKVIGELDSKGNLIFPGKTFNMSQTKAIENWLNQIKVFGAQGPPDGKEFWGLNQAQFESVVKGLSKPVPNEIKGKTLKEILDQLPIDKAFPIVIHLNAKQEFFQVESKTLSQELQGVSSGTALAAILKEHGYGFRPLRMPDTSIQISIVKLEDVKDAWPVGWETDQGVPRNQILPKLYEFVDTGFEEASLQRVLDAISAQTNITILIDYQLAKSRDLDVSTIQVSYPTKRTAWALVLESVVRQGRLTSKIMLDEANKPFVWVAPFVPYKLKK